MSMKILGPGKCVVALLAAALMIGCGDAGRNTGGGGDGRAASGENVLAGGTSAGGVATDANETRTTGDAAAGTIAGDAAGGGSADGGGGVEPSTERRVVLFIGTSLTAGLGLSPEQAYPALIQQRIDSAGLPFRVVNAGVSGETSAGALGRIDWLLRQPFEVVVLETGANDMLRGTDPASTERNIQEIIDRIRAANPRARIVLAGMRAMPNLGAAYASEFEPIYPRLAERNGLTLIPFLLDGVAGVRELNQADGVHPTAEGDRIVAETVWGVLGPMLREEAGGDELSAISYQLSASRSV